MGIRSDRRYAFEHPPRQVWAALTRVDEYRHWWPWLLEFDGVTLDDGSTWHCVVKPPLPYTVRFTIMLTDVVDAERVRANLDGDIRGSALLTLTQQAGGCELRLVSELTAVKGPAKLVGRWASPFAKLGHDWVLDKGASQFRTHVLAG